MAVIRLKILPPPLGASIIDRPRLESLLGRIIEAHRMVCVLASAGAGKTTAVLQASRRLSRPLAWLSVDSTDVHVGRLLVYLEAAIARKLPSAEGVVASALHVQLPPTEVAGLLAQSIGDSQLLLVIDNAENIIGEPDALALVTSFARYLPPTARLVLVSRRVPHFDPDAGTPFLNYVAAVGEEDFAFTRDEARDALARSGREDIDVEHAIVSTGGWVTGVLFEAWRSAEHVVGLGGEADPLHGYLATQILGRLPSEDREFLVSTSLLEEITTDAAICLGIPDAAARLASLRAVRLPGAWDHTCGALRCHPRFREYLRELLSRRSEYEVKALHLAYARLLVDMHQDELAVDEFLGAGETSNAMATAERVILQVVERTDFALAERWLSKFRPISIGQWPALISAELMLAVLGEDFRRGQQLADDLLTDKRGRQLTARSSRVAGLVAWCYLHAGRLDEIKTVLATGCDGDELTAMRYTMRLLEDPRPGHQRVEGRLTGGPFDGLVMRTHYDLGRLRRLLDQQPSTSPWAATATAPWRVGALLAAGHIERGFELLHELERSHQQGVWLSAIIGPKLMIELGEKAVGWDRLRRGRERIVQSGSAMFYVLSLLTEAELQLRINQDPEAALNLIDETAQQPTAQRYAYLREQRGTLLGAALLALGDNRRARDQLAEAVAGMRRGERYLWLPTAGIYLAEAHWRLGEEQAADDAATIALSGAEQQGSNHALLQALSEFPAVLSRRLDSEPRADSPWHEIGRALAAAGHDHSTPAGGGVDIVEFGRATVLVEGNEVEIRLRKSYELLTLLASRAPVAVARNELIEVLFDGRTDEAAGAYLRQAMLRLRKAIPDILASTGGAVALNPAAGVTTESERMVALLRQASSMRGKDRVQILLQVLELADRGEYLPGISSQWAEERRRYLSTLVEQARHDAAEAVFAYGDHHQAARLAEQVLRADPFRESMWRLQMKIADAFGDQDRVVSVYRQCEQAMAELGTKPAPTTTALLNDLRR
jgi:ATP/maltotriose-dependent transcriptional regulator MalT/DNA-binding SARP family transcriptional activator